MKIDSLIPWLCLVVLWVGIWLLRDRTLLTWNLKYRMFLRGSQGKNNLISLDWKRWSSRLNGLFGVQFLACKIKQIRERKCNREIFECITFLRNLAAVKQGETSGTDYVLERLSEHQGILQPILLRMLNLIRMNQMEEAASYFSKKTGTIEGRDFASLIIRWDLLKPEDLKETLYSLESSMKSARLTEQKMKDEMISDLIYFPVIVHILVIFVNFIYVAYFVNQQEMLQTFL